MTAWKPGERLDVIGPAGQGFRLDRKVKNHLLLAGGIGAAGLFMLAEQLAQGRKEDERRLIVLLGARTKGALLLEDDFRRYGDEVLVATDDGSRGFHGCVTDLLREAVARFDLGEDATLYACGPEPMYRVLRPLCRKHRWPAQVLMERRMMCGIGACLACVCMVDKEASLSRADLSSSHVQFSSERSYGYALVCRDGPVFDLSQVVFDE